MAKETSKKPATTKPKAPTATPSHEVIAGILGQVHQEVKKDPIQARICNFKIEDFQPFLDKVFTVKADNSENKLTLITCNSMRSYTIDANVRIPFSLIFELEEGVPFPQQMVSLETDGFEEISLFMSQNPPKEDGSYLYEIVFN